ncbi:MAG: SDR family oxidoreductase [Gammaproteobacteria bacterium]|nr:SDR family oxidoreductase [Gammaproteobacteria bacterium]MBU1440836.1 SDR family oxidoreductase [Gammaproteobacteria bacterium]MBU2287737.1 SDR family oxidoreductase [Gammaproteobacteria bacterium]MBU2408092.1 SDR family oxidoreductase [Gammaproteobacteria bacterium]
MSLQGKVAVVTGANRGIGRATAERLIAEGAQVLAVDLSVEEIGHLPLHRLAVDLASHDGPARVASEARRLGPVHCLVNNAGIGAAKSLADSDDELIDRVIGTNLRAVLRLTRDMLPLLGPDASIVNVSSVFGETGYPTSTAYAVTKAGISQMTRQLVADLSAGGVRVNAVAPGVIRTAMTEARLNGDEAYRKAMIGGTPLARIGTAAQVASVIAFLCSDDAAFVNGQVIAVDGGWLASRTRP